MDTAPVAFTEKQERVLERMERLAELRRAQRKIWRLDGAGTFIARLFTPRACLGLVAFSCYIYSTNPVTRDSIVLVVFAFAYAAFGSAVHFVIVPFMRRIDALEILLEAEIKRSPPL